MITVFSKLTGFALNVATLATLTAWEAGHLEDGARAWTADLHDAWVLSKNAIAGTAADGITVVAASGAGPSAFWIRQFEGDLYWNYQATWYVDSLNGTDVSSGASPAAALATVAEVGRRLLHVRQNSSFTVNVLNDVPATDSFVDMRRLSGGAAGAATYGSLITFQGQRNVQSTITLAAGTKQSDPAAAAASAQAEVVRAAGNWVVADVGKMVVDSAGNYAFILTAKDLAQTARVTDWLTSADAFTVAPQTEGSASVITLTKWRAPVQVCGLIPQQGSTGFAIKFSDFEFDDTGNNFRPFMSVGAAWYIRSSKVSNANGGTALRLFGVGSQGFAQLTGFMLHNTQGASRSNCTIGITSPGLHVNFQGGCGAYRTRLILAEASCIVLGMCFQDGYIENGVSNNVPSGGPHILGFAALGQGLGFYADFDSLNTSILAAIQVRTSGRLRVEGALYGTLAGTAALGGTNCLSSQDGGLMWLPKNMLTPGGGGTNINCFNLIPSAGATEFYLDGLANTVGTVTAANGGAVLPIAIVCTTFAQYIGAVPNGFARNMRNMSNDGGFLQGI